MKYHHARATLSRLAAIALISMLAATASHAVNYTGLTGGNWNTGSNWAGGVVPNSAGIAVSIPNTAAISTILDIDATVGSISNANTGSRHWTIQDDASHFSLTLDNATNGNAVIESNSNTSAMNVYANVIISNTDLDIKAGGSSSGSGATNVGVLNTNTITAAASSTRALNFKANGIKAITVNSSIGVTGGTLNLTNGGTGTGTTTLNGNLGPNVASITQSSATSTLFIKGADNSGFVGNTIVTAGKLSFSTAFTMAGASTNSFSLTGMASPVAGTNYGQIAVTAGTLNFGGSLTLNFSGTAVDATVYDLFNTSGTGALASSFSSMSVAGSYTASLTNNSGVWTGTTLDGLTTFSFSQATGDLTVTASAVPEPATYAALAGFVTLGAVVIRRRRS